MVECLGYQSHLIPVHVGARLRGSSDIRAHKMNLESITQEPKHDCIDRRIFE